MSAPAQPIRRRRLHELLAEQLLARIRAGDPPPGGTLPSEMELMKQFEVGRPAVREALLRLESMGIISISHGARARVLPPSADDIVSHLGESIVHLLATEPSTLEHLKNARVDMEAAFVRRATARLDEAELAKLEGILERQARAIQVGAGYHAADMAFHVAIAEAAGNPLYAVFLRAVLDWLGEFYASAVRIDGMSGVSHGEHRRILDAMLARDADRAEVAMREHLLRSSSLYGAHQRKAR